MNVFEQFVEFVLRHEQDWETHDGITPFLATPSEQGVIKNLLEAAGFGKVKLDYGLWFRNPRKRTLLVNTLSPFLVYRESGEVDDLGTGWLNAAVFRVLSGRKHREDFNRITRAIQLEAMKAVPFRPIALVGQEVLQELSPHPPVRNPKSFFVARDQEGSRIRYGVIGIHGPSCSGIMYRRQSEKPGIDVVLCSHDDFRHRVPESDFTTYGRLREFFRAERQSRLF